MTDKIKIITHDRVVHADESMAAAVLRMAFKNVEVLRTRDPVILRAEAGLPNVFLLDVGGQYDPSRRLFDHHQKEGAGFRNEAAREWPYATAGLVWKEYGAAAVLSVYPGLSADVLAEVVQHIDDSVLKYIDAADCGVKVRTAGPSLSGQIASFNPAWFEPEENVFPLVMDLAQVLLTNFIKRQLGKVLAREKVRKAHYLLDGQVMMLDTCLPWSNVVADEMPNVQLVVYPVGGNDLELESDRAPTQWQVQIAVNSDNTPRIRLPMRWAGLERATLAEVTGEPTAEFCHRNRHLTGAATLEGALHLAVLALREHQAELRARQETSEVLVA